MQVFTSAGPLTQKRQTSSGEAALVPDLACHTESLDRTFRAKGRLLDAIPWANLQINVHFEAEAPDGNNI